MNFSGNTSLLAHILARAGLSRRALLCAALPLLGGTALLAGCGSAPRRQAAASGGGAVLRSTHPALAVVDPVSLPANFREEAVARAMLTVNTPYRYGGNSLDSGFDCSGLVQYVFNGFANRPLPRSTRQWAQASLPVGTPALQRGDLVFFNTSGAAFSHMGIFVGNNQFVHAPSSGGTVRIASLYNSYFAPRFNGGRTVFA